MHFGQWVSGWPITRYATATRSMYLLFLIIFNNLCILHCKFWHFVGQVAMHSSLEREVWDSNLGPVKSDTVLPTAHHRCKISLKEPCCLGAMTWRWALPTLYTFQRIILHYRGKGAHSNVRVRATITAWVRARIAIFLFIINKLCFLTIQ